MRRAVARREDEELSLVGRDDVGARLLARPLLDERGWAVTPHVLRARECAQLARLYEGGDFRSRFDMRRHGFGPRAGRAVLTARRCATA